MIQIMCAQVGLSEGQISANANVSGGENFWVTQLTGEAQVHGETNYVCANSPAAKQITCGNVNRNALKNWRTKLVTPDKTFESDVAGRIEVK